MLSPVRNVRRASPATRDRTRAGMRRRDEAPLATTALLQLIRLASPSLPVGGFSYSEGIEAAVDAALVTDEASACAWLLDQLELGVGRSDLPVAARALAAWRRGDRKGVAEWNAWLATTRETNELRRQSEQMGRSLAQWLRQRSADDDRIAFLDALSPAPLWPLAFALAAADSGASARAVLASLAAGWAENATQAALKAVPLGQSAAQRILAALSAAIPGVVDRALAMATSEVQAFVPMLAILSSQHEEQYSRLFRS